ncbi:MAG: neutral/alkaline non-lysosomal ceramidase N-terminal domain-containing protein [Bacteroidales bacterium]|nr:neutral/alkaline non-lysosomal ceramidase N-terminal domain-containing protein [Bacteroidales bacterium]
MKIKYFLSVCLVLLSLSALAQTHFRGPLKAGAAKVNVTPGPDQLGRNTYGVLDSTHVRAIIFTNGNNIAGLANVDGNTNQRVIDAVNERLEKDFGIPKGNIIYNGTHCHSTGTVPMDELIERTYQAVKQAYENMVPAKVGYGSGVSYLNVKRDLFDPERGTWWEGPDYDGKSDKTVAVIYFESLDGKPIATYYNYAMHAVITGQLDMITGDFPGKSEEYIESRYGPDFVAVFASGAAGDQNPLYFQQTFDLRDIRIEEYAKRGEDISNRMPPGGVGLDRNNPEVHRLMEEQKKMAESYGQLLGEEVKYVIMMMRRFETNVTLEAARTVISCPGRRQTNGGGRAGYAGEYEDANPIDLELGLVMLDQIPVCAVAGEVYNPIAVELKSKSPFAFTIMTTVADGHSGRGGYIPDDESYGAQVFEVLGSGYKQGYAQKAIVDTLLDMIHDATH